MNLKEKSHIHTYIMGVFAAIFVPIALFISSDFWIKKQYFDFKNLEFKNTIKYKVDEYNIDSPLPGKIYLLSDREIIVQRNIFNKLKVGDSVIKNVNCDSIFYYTSKGILIYDENEFRRNKFLETLD